MCEKYAKLETFLNQVPSMAGYARSNKVLCLFNKFFKFSDTINYHTQLCVRYLE